MNAPRLSHRNAEEANLRFRPYDLSSPSPLAAMTDMPWYPPYAVDTWHEHNCMEIGLCLSGSGEIASGEHRWHFSGGAVFLVPEGVLHYQRNAGETVTHWRYLAVDTDHLMSQIPAASRRAIQSLLEGRAKTGLFLESGEAAEDAALFIRWMFEKKQRFSEGAQAELEGLLLALLTRLCREEGRDASDEERDAEETRPIEPALLYIADHYAAEIRVEELAKSCAMSQTYFRRVFRRIMNLSPLEYVNRYRIHRAMNLLRVTDENVFRVALLCGFSSVSAFNRNFLRCVGESPSDWRRAH